MLRLARSMANLTRVPQLVAERQPIKSSANSLSSAARARRPSSARFF
jgi:hypothetical protein